MIGWKYGVNVKTPYILIVECVDVEQWNKF
jgi:hypothetical protein